MTITDATDEIKCCCSCRHNIRTFDGRYNCTIKCDKDGHYIGYASNFVSVCDEWEEDTE